MIKLSEWFKLNTSRPLGIAGVLILSLWFSIAVKSYLEIGHIQQVGFDQLRDVTALALQQKNRMLIESILFTAQTQARALSVAVCHDGEVILSSRAETVGCSNHNSLFTRMLVEPIPGFADYRLMMSFSRLALASEQLIMLVTGLFLLGIILLILRQVQTKFTLEVVGPLNYGIFSDDIQQICEFEELRKTHHEVQNAKTSVAVAAAVVSMSSQVAHDIRSPLAALNMVVATLKELPEEKRLIIRNASQRINDIANGLLQQSKNAISDSAKGTNLSAQTAEAQQTEPVMLVSLLDAIISEKRIQFRERMDIEIQGDLNRGYGLFARVNGSELSRVISNLINNSVEAFTGPGRVTVAIRGYTDQVAVIVSDNGKGIPHEVLARLGERGVTHGKEGTSSGSGLGVYHARETIEKAGGKFNSQSQIGMGTMITLTLPRAESPKWFVEKISLSHGTRLVSADDDQTIHQIWSGRLSSAGSAKANIEHLTFSSLEQFEAWVNTHKSDSHKYLVDYEFLGQAGNGLDVVERLGIAKQAILVTSRYEEKNVRDRAADMGIRILPKTLAPFVPLEIEAPRERYDAVLLDDDSLIKMMWQMAAKESGKTLLYFSTPEEFYLSASKIHPESPIYIDVNLGDGIRGEEVAVKVSSLGFKNIYLATGYEASAITPPACVRKVVGKDPVF